MIYSDTLRGAFARSCVIRLDRLVCLLYNLGVAASRSSGLCASVSRRSKFSVFCGL